jgi:ankyrin repeat protein
MNLILAIQRGDLKQVKYLLEEESLNIERKDSIGNTPFLVSVDSKKLEIVKYLIEKGANINARTLNGWTALMMAAEDNSFEMVKLLVENGINIDAQENNGANVLFMAISKADSKIIKYLVKNESDLNSVSPKSGFTPFLSYAGKGRIEDLQFLIDSGADINVTEYELFTPLMI